MKLHYHPTLTVERWRSFSWDKRLLNVGSELIRARMAVKKKDEEARSGAFARALELTDLTVESGMEGKTPGFLHELLRFREVLGDFYLNPEKKEDEIVKLTRAFFDLDPVIHNMNLQI